MRRKANLFGCVVLGLVVAGAAQADTSAYSFVPNAEFLDPGSFTLGIKFTATSNLTVSALGYFDSYFAFHGVTSGLHTTHAVGIFDNSGSLLASTTVDAGTTDSLIGDFRYKPITPFSLAAGQTYTIGGVTTANGDPYSYGSDSLTTDPGISTIGHAFIAGGGGLTYPTTAYASFYIGPNFQISSATPEPGTSALFVGLVIASSGAFLLRRRA